MLPKLVRAYERKPSSTFENGKNITRKLNPDRTYTSLDGKNKSSWKSFVIK